MARPVFAFRATLAAFSQVSIASRLSGQIVSPAREVTRWGIARQSIIARSLRPQFHQAAAKLMEPGFRPGQVRGDIQTGMIP